MLRIISYYQKIDKRTINWGVFIVLSIFFFTNSRSLSPNYIGDANDYIMMIASQSNHLTPDLTNDDIKSINKYYTSFNDNNTSFPDISDKYDVYNGYYKDKYGNFYNYHFWFYTLMVTPLYKLLEFLDIHPYKAFFIFNTSIFLLFFYYMLFKSKFSRWKSISIITIVYFSSFIWYIRAIHTEAYTMIFVVWAMFLFFDKKYYSALLLASLSAIQNPPLIALVGYLFLETLFRNKFTIKNIIKLGACSIWALSSYIFYFIFYGKFSLIAGNYIQADNFNFRRFIGIFFNLDQGMIYAIPLILPLFIVIYVITFYQQIKVRKLNSHILIPFVICIICLGFIGMSNWNHGMLVVSRYVTWLSMIIIAYFVFLTHKKRYFKFIIIPIIISQIWITNIYGGSTPSGWRNDRKAISKYLIENYPNLYNPDYHIFQIREKKYTTDKLFLPLLNYEGIPYKIGLTKEDLPKLKGYGYSQEQINRFKEEVPFYANHGYINEPPAYPEIQLSKFKYSKVFFDFEDKNINNDTIYSTNHELFIINNNEVI